MRISRRGFLAGGLAAAGAASVAVPVARAAKPDNIPAGTTPIEVQSFPLRGFNLVGNGERFGALKFRGGAELQSPFEAFGGISGLSVTPDGQRFTAITDAGAWLRGRLTYDGAMLTGMTDCAMAPILGRDGKSLIARREADTEALAFDEAGAAYIGVERLNAILKFDFARDGFNARGVPIPMPAEARRIPFNRGLEAVAMAPRGHQIAGTLVAFAERALDADGNHTGFLIGGPSPGPMSLARSDDYDVTDAAFIPGGDLVVMERRYSPLRGVALRMRRVAAAALVPGAKLEGAVLIDVGQAHQIDNMEGLSVHRGAAGETLLTLVSDNNFSALQRNIVLQFELAA